MKKFLLLAAAAAWCNMGMAKQLDVQVAQIAAHSFLDAKLGGATDMQLVYTAHAASGSDNYYYVFNAGNKGFVMVTADDRVMPVIGYSTEGAFDPNNIPSNAKIGLLDNYSEQIAYVINNNIPATKDIEVSWNMLIKDQQIGWRTTASKTVAPLVVTKWNQSPYYNDMCPKNPSTSELTVSGCVATAMTQVMKYWNYPATGQGSHSYTTAKYGNLNADFSVTNYDWSAMPNSISSANTAIATLTYHAGVAVNMNYNVASAGGSGAWVVKQDDPNGCAEYALVNYFKYANTTHGILRSDFLTTQAWIDTLKNEISSLRPVMYVGYGSGGHCWVVDGYDANDMFHCNWGWGGMSDGYFTVSAMNPSALGAGGGTGGFNSRQQAVIGIQPDNMTTPDRYEGPTLNNQLTTPYAFPSPANSGTTTILTTGADFHASNDVDHYTIVLPTGDNYVVKARIHDKANSTDGNTYTVNAKFGFSRNPTVVWSTYKEVEMAEEVINGGGPIYFRVIPSVLGEMGNYTLQIDIERKTTGIGEVNGINSGIAVYPNPANNEINIALDNKVSEIALVNMQGQTVQHISTTGQANAKLDVSSVANGLYMIHIKSGDINITRKVSVAHQ